MGAIANKASLTLPKDLNPPEAKQAEFAEKFGISWPDALAQDKVFNALDGCTKLGLSGDEMDTQWAKTKKAGQLVKFGGGFYAGLVAGGVGWGGIRIGRIAPAAAVAAAVFL